MERKQLVMWCCAVAVVLIWGSHALAGPAGLLGYWKFDEGQGTTAFDSSGNGLDGTLRGSPTWVGGMVEGALKFNGSSDCVEIPNNPLLSLTTQITIAAWTYMNTNASGEMAVLSKGGWAANNLPYELTEENGGVIFWQFYNDAGRDSCSPSSPAAGEWHHIAATYDGQIFKCYIDGVLADEWAYTGKMPTNTASLTIGRRSTGGCFYNGMLDDVQLWDRALSDAEVLTSMAGLVDASQAQDPYPEDEATDVPCDVTLAWTSGETAATHDVYLGTVFADVNDTSRDDASDVLVSQDQGAAEYDPQEPLGYDQTYYWRVDEVNSAPDYTIFKGQVWRFTTEPYAYPIEGITATASTYGSGMGPENTVNGSGLDADDRHSNDLTQMWMTTGDMPAWIQFEFDRAYKLHEMWVWNSNYALETLMGFGARTVTVEYSTDGQSWTSLEGVPEFAQANGELVHAVDASVAFGGVFAKFVKLTIESNWSTNGSTQTGLSEVRFFYVPVEAFAPDPADGATGVSVDPKLDWRPGREMTSHTVYLSADEAAVANGTAPSETLTAHGYSPSSLEFATEYFWKVDESSESGTYPGSVWSFTTEEFALIDDFESYNDSDRCIYDIWIDGYATKTNGSTVGYMESAGGTFGERTIIHGGKQSMPLLYDNTKSPFYSEAVQTFDSAQDWTSHGADTLSVFFQGIAQSAGNSSEGLYLTVTDKSGKSKTVTNEDPSATTVTEWRQWKIPLSEFTSAGVKVTAVESLTIGVGNRAAPTTGGTGTIYIDDIGYGHPLP